jgi:hypothetical protein
MIVCIFFIRVKSIEGTFAVPVKQDIPENQIGLPKKE